ncbi:MAG: prepilin peptidase [Caulobacteraceae bacterium]|jgi:prepilin peptidase CpaA|nr:prepilin peptidase [Caulobacteraceae bacterium]
MPHLLQLVLILAFPALMIVAALRDCSTFTIPNWISLALLGLFPLAAFAVGLPLPAIGLALLLGVGGLLVGMGMFAAGWIGGGDAKILAAATPWLGLAALGPFLVVTAVAGGGLAVFLLFMRSGQISPLLAQGPTWLARLATRGENVPYGVAIAVGALSAFPASDIAQRVLVGF